MFLSGKRNGLQRRATLITHLFSSLLRLYKAFRRHCNQISLGIIAQHNVTSAIICIQDWRHTNNCIRSSSNILIPALLYLVYVFNLLPDQ